MQPSIFLFKKKALMQILLGCLVHVLLRGSHFHQPRPPLSARPYPALAVNCGDVLYAGPAGTALLKLGLNRFLGQVPLLPHPLPLLAAPLCSFALSLPCLPFPPWENLTPCVDVRTDHEERNVRIYIYKSVTVPGGKFEGQTG